MDFSVIVCYNKKGGDQTMIYNFDNLSFQILTVDRFFHQKGFFEVNTRPYAALSFRVSGTGDFEIGTALVFAGASLASSLMGAIALHSSVSF